MEATNLSRFYVCRSIHITCIMQMSHGTCRYTTDKWYLCRVVNSKPNRHNHIVPSCIASGLKSDAGNPATHGNPMPTVHCTSCHVTEQGARRFQHELRSGQGRIFWIVTPHPCQCRYGIATIWCKFHQILVLVTRSWWDNVRERCHKLPFKELSR